MDSHVLMVVIVKINKRKKANMFIHTLPYKPEQVLKFLRDKVGVKNLKKVVLSSHNILAHTTETLRERVNNLESLGFVVDGTFIEKYNGLLNFNPTTIKEKAKALESALGPRYFLSLCVTWLKLIMRVN